MSLTSESLHQDSSRAAHQIDLGPGEWEEVAADRSSAKNEELCAIVGFWVLAMLLFAVVVATPALEAMARRLT